MTTHAEGGSAGATAVTPVLAIAISDDHTNATLGSLASGKLELSGALDASASHDGSHDTLAKGDTKSGDTGVGISLALTVAVDSTNATTARNIDSTGAVSFSARTASVNKAQAKASVAGGENKAATAKDKNDQKGGVNNDVHNASTYGDDRGAKSGASTKSSSKTDGKATGDTADGSVQVAGALGVTVAVTEAHATIADGLTVKSGGVLTLKAQNNTDAAASADGSAKTDKTGTGVGIAVAVNVGVAETEAQIGKGADVTAAGVSLQATSKDKFSASAVSGASQGDTGVAGSLAVNVGISHATAELADNAVLTITGGKDVELKAQNFVTNTVTAKAQQEGAKSFGMGASIAVNVGVTGTDAIIGDGAALDDAHNVTLSASSSNQMLTRAEGGAKGDTAITPVVAVAVSTDDTNAKLETYSGTVDKWSGAVALSASHKGGSETIALGDTKSGDTGVGISIAVTVALDNAVASTARDVKADGAVSFDASVVSANEARAVASVAGGQATKASTNDKSDDKGGVNNQTHNQTKAADDRGSKSGANTGATSKTDSKGSTDTSNGAVQVAGAVGVAVAITHSEATIGDGLKIESGGALSLKAHNNTDAAASGDGAATTKPGGTGVGIGIAVDYAEANNTATIGKGATVVANGLSMEAGMADRAVGIDTANVDIVDSKADTIFVGAGAGLHTGDKVKYNKGGSSNTAIGGLIDSINYYVIEAGNGKIKLAASEADAVAGTAIDLTTPATGTAHKFERSGLFGTFLFAPDAIVFDPASNHRLVDLGKGSVLHTGDAVTYKSAAGAADDIGGLSDDKTYYVIRYDDNTAELAATRADALAGHAIGLTSGGTGKAHSLVESASVFRSEARSGASGGDTGVAGSVAVSIGVVTHEAVVRGDKTTPTTVTLGGGNVDLEAANTTDSITIAVPRASGGEGKSLGIGASFAVNVDVEHARAEVEDGVAFTSSAKLGHANVEVDSTHILQSEARTGAKSSGDTAIGGAVSVIYGEHHSTARLGDGVDIDLSGDLNVSASHAAEMKSTVDSEASGKNAGIGVSIAVAIGVDDTRAAVGGKVDADGKATIIATHSLLSEAQAKASAKGADGDSKDDKSVTPIAFNPTDSGTSKNVDTTG